MNKPRNVLSALACTLLVSAIPSGMAYAHDDDGDRHHGDKDFKIEVLSSRPYMVSGGDALVRVTVKDRKVRLGSVRIELNGANVTGAFRADAAARTLTGLVTGLRLGPNELEVDAKGKGKGRADADISLTNYAIQGPIISGPQEFPFACTTQNFVPYPGGAALGAPLDSDCSIARRVNYVYRKTSGQFAALPQPFSTLPADAAMTTTVTGATVPFIVRLETGTINRAIYQTAVLHNPNSGEPSPFAPPAAWNGRLIYPLGGGCIAGWYTQGPDLVSPLNATWLGKGHAIATATLNTFGNNCNDLLSSETIIMVKERFIESYGVPKFTIGTGSSGGAYQSNQTGDNYPGTFDGIVTMNSFPDVTTGMVPMHSSRLFELYLVSRPGRYTVDQVKAMTGYLSVSPQGPDGKFLGELQEMSRVRGDRMDPRVAFQDGVEPGVGPQSRYDPATNPFGARGDVYDHTVNVYGVIANTPVPGLAKFAQRPLDNVGVQYGLRALNTGAIMVEDFLDLNANMGGVDIDFTRIPTRTVHYPDATKRAYQGGRILGGGGGLASTAIITRSGGNDLITAGDVHLRYHSFAIRQRLINANSHADNQVIVGNLAPSELLLDQMGAWLTAVVADTSNRSRAEKVVANKPHTADPVADPVNDVVDACWTTAGVKIREAQTLDGTGLCNTLFPRGVPPEYVAGAPIALDIIKCQLKPIDMNDYKGSFSTQQRARLAAIFPTGVCDWSKKGVKQMKSVPWASYGPSPVNQVFDIQDRRRHGDDDDDD
jgi:uncharacterized tannase-like protein DUF6351